mgnify:CR=1 FL=1
MHRDFHQILQATIVRLIRYHRFFRQGIFALYVLFIRKARSFHQIFLCKSLIIMANSKHNNQLCCLTTLNNNKMGNATIELLAVRPTGCCCSLGRNRQ